MEQLTGFTVANRTVEFDTAPTADVLVTIYRVTPTEPLVGWADASVIKALDMTVAQVQQLHIIEENRDWSRTNSIVLEDNVYNMRFHRVINVADPQDPQDVVTKKYMETVQGGFVQQNTALVQQATQQAGIATTKAGEASASASAAKTSETNAQKWAESTESPDGQGDSESPTGKTQSAKEWAVTAKTWAEQANILTVNDIPAVNKNIYIKRKFYKSFAELGLQHATVTFKQIFDSLPTNASLNDVVNASSSSGVYTPNLNLPNGFAGTLFVTKGGSSAHAVQFTLMINAQNVNTPYIYTCRYHPANESVTPWQEILGVIEQVQNATGGYIKYSDGRMEQWGEFTTDTIPVKSTTSKTITFPQVFTNNKYNVTAFKKSGGNSWATTSYKATTRNTTNIKFDFYAFETEAAPMTIEWRIYGWWK